MNSLRNISGWRAEAYVKTLLEEAGYFVLDLAPAEGADLYVKPSTIVEVKSSSERRKAFWNLERLTPAEQRLSERWIADGHSWWVGVAVLRNRRTNVCQVIRTISKPPDAPITEVLIPTIPPMPPPLSQFARSDVEGAAIGRESWRGVKGNLTTTTEMRADTPSTVPVAPP